MRETDNRHLSLEALSEKRRTAFHMQDQGYKRLAMAAALDVNPSTLSGWFSRVRREGRETVIVGGKRVVSQGADRVVYC